MWTTTRISIFDNTTTVWTKLLVTIVPLSLILPHLLGMSTLEIFTAGLITISYVVTMIYISISSSNRTIVEVGSYFKCTLLNKPAEVNYYIPDGVEFDGDETKRIYRFKWRS